MERRQNGGQRRKIVQDYLAGISDDQERIVCFLYVNNYGDFEIRRFMRIARKRLNEIKAAIRKNLIAAGIRMNSTEKVAM